MYSGIFWIFLTAGFYYIFSKQYIKALICAGVFFTLNFIMSLYLVSFVDVTQLQGGFSKALEYYAKFEAENSDKVHKLDFIWILAASYYVADIGWTIISKIQRKK